MRAELHTHTTASDGQHTPSELVALARGLGLDVLAITDHDTTDGLAPARSAALGAPIILPGIELSAEDGEDVHVLGYAFDPDDAALQTALAEFRARRVRRARAILDKLVALGVPIAWERVEALAAGSVGRPHIARIMVEAGYVDSVRDAFDRYLGNGAPAYVARQRLSPEEAVQLIHAAGGAAVLAHPGLLADWRGMVERLIPVGLDGVEVFHPKNGEQVRLDLRVLAAQHDLIITAGSDFHGRAVNDAPLGAMTPPPGTVEALRARAREWQARR